MSAEDRLVVDSSVVASVVLREPGYEVLARRLAALEFVCSAPFFRFDVANAVWKQRDWPDEEVQVALDLVFSLPIHDEFGSDDAAVAMDIARRHHLPFYDAAFIALARNRRLPLWSLDRRQREVAEASGVLLAGE
jgi:predicted nucleic acid-binding protein